MNIHTTRKHISLGILSQKLFRHIYICCNKDVRIRCSIRLKPLEAMRVGGRMRAQRKFHAMLPFIIRLEPFGRGDAVREPAKETSASRPL